MDTKYVADPIQSIPEKEQELLTIPDFDIRTKALDSQNVKVFQNRQLMDYQKLKHFENNQHRHLTVIEKDVLDIANQGAVVNLPNEMIENLYRVFLKSKEKGREHLSFVLREGYLVNILEDVYFESKLDSIVRLSVDNEPETLD
jgi:uncharacterized protein YrrD